MILEVMKELNNQSSQSNTFGQTSDILPPSYSESMSKQSLLSDEFLREGLEPVKNFLAEVSGNLEAECMKRIDSRFREVNNTLVRNIHHYERVLKALDEKHRQVREKRKL